MIPIIVLPHYKGDLPTFATSESAGVDLRAAIETNITLNPNEDVVIPSGLKMHIGSCIPSHLQLINDLRISIYGMIAPRSGLGFKHYVRLANTVGIIDADYQGEIMIKIRNEGNQPLVIEPAMRICQMVFNVCINGFGFDKVDSFTNSTERGEGGFGHSGAK